MKKMLIMLSLLVLARFCVAANYPNIGTGTEPNQWTSNFSGVLQAASKTGYPILAIMVNSEGCQHCSIFIDYTINTEAFNEIVANQTFYMVMLDYHRHGATSDWAKLFNRYNGYLDYGFYPLCVVLRTDGSVYRYFGNTVTDYRSVAPDLAAAIGELGGTSGNENGGYVNPVVPAGITQGEAEAKFKGKYAGILFNSKQSAVGSIAVTIGAKGKVKAKISRDDRKDNVKGALLVDKDGIVTLKTEDGASFASYDDEKDVWSGKYGSDKVVFRQSGQGGSSMVGIYTAKNLAADGLTGYSVFTYAKSGKVKVAGKTPSGKKIACNIVPVVLPASFIASDLSNWATGGDMAIGYGYKRDGFNGGVGISAAGDIVGSFEMDGKSWDIGGGKWNTSANVSVFNGSTLDVPNVLSGSLSAAGSTKFVVEGNDFSVKVNAAPKKGTFKGQLILKGAKNKFEGVLLESADGYSGFGIKTSGDSGFSVLSF